MSQEDEARKEEFKNSVINDIVYVLDKAEAVASRIDAFINYIKRHKLSIGVSSTTFSVICLAFGFWISTLSFGWSYINNAPTEGSLHPIIGNLIYPLLTIGIILLPIGTTLLYLAKKSPKT